MKRDIKHKFKKYRCRYYSRSMPGAWKETSAANIDELLAQIINPGYRIVKWRLDNESIVSVWIAFSPDHIRISRYEIEICELSK